MKGRAETIIGRPPFRLWDTAVFAALLLLIVSAFIWFMPKTAGDTVTVYRGETPVHTMSLSTDARYTYAHEGHTNVIEVKDGRVSVAESNCPDGLCKSFPPVSREGGSVICLPHRLYIVVAHSGAYDGVVRLW